MSKGKVDFELLGLPAGTLLTHVEDPTATCEIAPDKYVLFEGRLTNLSRSAQIVRERLGMTRADKVQGPKKWRAPCGRTIRKLQDQMP